MNCISYYSVVCTTGFHEQSVRTVANYTNREAAEQHLSKLNELVLPVTKKAIQGDYCIIFNTYKKLVEDIISSGLDPNILILECFVEYSVAEVDCRVFNNLVEFLET